MTKTITVAVPSVTSATTYYYYACVTAADGETVTGDNCSGPAEVRVRAPVVEQDLPNLTIPSVTVSPTNPESNGWITMQITVHNRGAGSAGSETIWVYRHAARTANPTVNGARIFQTAQSGSLAAGASATHALSTVVPSVTSATTYYYYACVDAAAGEQQTDDNCSLEPAEVRVGGGGSVAVAVGSGLILSISATPAITESGTQVAARVTVKNDGTASAESETIHLYRHASRTANPTSGGSRLATTATTGSLAAGAQVTKTIIASVPSVTADAIYYYYACVGAADGEVATGDNCAGPAEVSAYPSTFIFDPDPPYGDCYSSPKRETPMGGDSMTAQPLNATVSDCGTITLGGIETADGVRGFIVSGHAVAESYTSDISSDGTDTFVGHDYHRDTIKLKHLLGKVVKMPSSRREGGKKILSVDAAFVAYPHPQTSGCSLPWRERSGSDTFCLELGSNEEYVDRITPLVIRGKRGDIYKVVGSKQPTKGLKVVYSGSVSGPGEKTGTVDEKILVSNSSRGLYYYGYITTSDVGTVLGDSGSPVYTTPDTNGNVHIIGIHRGVLTSGEFGKRATFSPWSDVVKEFNLKPISP